MSRKTWFLELPLENVLDRDRRRPYFDLKAFFSSGEESSLEMEAVPSKYVPSGLPFISQGATATFGLFRSLLTLPELTAVQTNTWPSRRTNHTGVDTFAPLRL